MGVGNLMPADRNGRVVQAGTTIRYIDNITINASTYVAVTVPAEVWCKALMIQTRAGNAFRLATSATPTNYASIAGPVSFNMRLRESVVVGYVRAETTADTLEIIYLD